MRLLAILCCIICSAACIASELGVDIRLKKTAETEGYGYKTANLHELNRVREDTALRSRLSQLGVELRIPAFCALPSGQIVDFLKENGMDIERVWDAIPAEERSDMIAHKRISEKLANHLQEVRKRIKNIFLDPTHFSIVATADFLNFVQNSSPWIVRSSGSEDKVGLTNAGGNESVKSLSRLNELFPAMGEVISSYFSEKSIGQRLLAGDLQLFCSPILPILVQEMVIAKTRPLEAVVHTSEQLGPTPGLVSVNCGYDVVGSEKRADLYYCDLSGAGHAILAKGIDHLTENDRIAIALLATAIEKHYQRAMDIELLIAPNGNGTSTIHLVQARPLNCLHLSEDPSYLSDFSLEPTILAETIATAGPHVRTITNPSQLVIAKTLKEAEEQFLFKSPHKERVEAILVESEAEPNSHEATTFSCSGKLVMRVDDLKKLTPFLESGSFYLDPQQGVIAKKGEISKGLISHPIPERVSIEAVANLYTEELKNWEMAKEAPQIFWPERGDIAKGKTRSEDEKYGAKPTPAKTNSSITMCILDLPFAILECDPESDIPSLLKRLKQADERESVHSLSSLLFRLQNERVQLQGAEKTAAREEALQKIDSLYCFAKQKAASCILFLKNPSNDLRRLAAIKPIEALFLQSEDPDLENCYSLRSTLEKYRKRTAFSITSGITENLPLLDALCEGAEVAMTIDLKKKWFDFISALKSSELHQLSEMIHSLSDLDAFSPWMHIVFSKTDNFEELYAEYLEAFVFLRELRNQCDRFSSISAADWGKPDRFESLMRDLHLEDILSEEFTQIFRQAGRLKRILALSFMNHFIDRFDDQFIKTLLRSAGYSSQEQKVFHFKRVVEAYFSILKAWAPFSTLSQDAYSWAFADFLDDIKMDVPILFGQFDFSSLPLSELLEIASGFPEDLFEELPQTTKDLIHDKYPSADLKEGSLLLVKERFKNIETFSSYIEKLQEGIRAVNPLSGQELFPPPHFNVASEIFVNISKKQKKVSFGGYTLAAFFTLIHQNINSILTNLAVQAGLGQFQRPLPLQAVESQIQKLGFLVDESGQIKTPSLIGVKCAKDAIHLVYNLPLKLHGITYEIKYHHLSRDVELKMNLVSIDNDLSILSQLFQMGASFLKAKNISVVPFEQDMTVAFTLNSSSQIEMVGPFLQCMHELTSSRFKELRQNHTEYFSSLINQDDFKKLLGDL